LFKSAREDDVVAEDPAASVKSAHNRATSPNKRSFTLDELRIVLERRKKGVTSQLSTLRGGRRGSHLNFQL